MDEIVFTAELPDGSFQPCFSPSPVVKEYFSPGQEVAACEFIRLSRIALTEASRRVSDQPGVSESPRYSSLNDIERWAGALPPETRLTICHVG